MDEPICDNSDAERKLTQADCDKLYRELQPDTRLLNSGVALPEHIDEAALEGAECFMPPPPEQVRPTDINKKPEPKVDWSPLAALTGTRPVVDRYSISRFSQNEWRAKNKATMRKTISAFDEAEKDHYHSKTALMRVGLLIDNTQKETTRKLRARAQLIRKWKDILEAAIRAMADEISKLEEERLRMKKSLLILGVPESIVKECIQLRAGRPETELVRDTIEEQLVQEQSLILEIREQFKKTCEDIEQQQRENRAARERMEYDWSDKQQAFEIDVENLSWNNESTNVLFRPGAVRQPAEQSSEPNWEYYTRKNLEECEQFRQKSVKLRQGINSILTDAARDLRKKADEVNKVFTGRINCLQINVQRLENDLRKILKQLADTETRIIETHRVVGSFDTAMKVAQSRMYNRNFRPHAENCRDLVQEDLINEVATIQSSVTATLSELAITEGIQTELMSTRGHLEHEIMLKRLTLYIDRDRCMTLRARFPSINALSGNVTC